MFVPENWNTLDEFVAWYKYNNYPFRVPQNARIVPTDVSFSCCIFRQGLYQVELYLAKGNFKSTRHSHPFEQKIIYLGGHLSGKRGQDSHEFGPAQELGSPVLPSSSGEEPNHQAGLIGLSLLAGQWHEIEGKEQGFIFLNCQKWPNKEMMSSAVIEYDGESLGAIHDQVIRSKNPE